MKAKGVALSFYLAVAVASGAALSDAAAAEIAETATVEEAFGPNGTVSAQTPGGGILRPLGVTVLLFGLAGGLFVLLRRLGGRRPPGGGRTLSVLETAYLSPKHSVVLVRVRNRVLLLGLGQDVRTLSSFDQPEDVLGFDGDFQRELSEALSGEETEPAAEAAEAAEAGTAPRRGLEPYREQISQLRGAVVRWRDRLRGEAKP
jgi:flagellar biogenesis protein FliO